MEKDSLCALYADGRMIVTIANPETDEVKRFILREKAAEALSEMLKTIAETKGEAV